MFRKRTPAQQSSHVPLGDIYKQLVADQLKPYFKQRGFAKYGMHFSRVRGELVDTVNIQGSKWNGLDSEHTFFINGGMDSLSLRSAIGQPENKRQQYYTALMSGRLGWWVEGPSECTFTHTTDMDAFTADLLHQLDKLLTCFETVTDTSQLINDAIERNFLNNYEEICQYLSATKDTARLEKYVSTLHHRFKDDVRWPFFSEKIRRSIAHSTVSDQLENFLAPLSDLKGRWNL